MPQAGDTFLVVADERKARQIATVRTERDKLKGKGVARVTLEDLHKQIAAGEVKELRLILKADVQGSVEALTESLERLSTDEVRLRVIHGSVGTVNESDVMLASASNAIVLGFNVKADNNAERVAQLVEEVQRVRLHVGVVEEALHPGVAGVAAGRARAGRGAIGPLAGDGLVTVESRAELLVELLDALIRLARLLAKVVAGTGILLDRVLGIGDALEELRDLIVQAFQATMRITAMVAFILVGATCFSITFQGVDGNKWVEHLMSNLPGGVWGFLVVVNLFVFFLAFFLDFFEIAFIIVPMLAPVAQKIMEPVVGHDAALIWFGVMLCVNVQTSFMHPPFGFALFYLRGVAPKEVKSSDIYWGALPWIGLQMIMVVLVIAFPITVTGLLDKPLNVDLNKIRIEIHEIELPPPLDFGPPPKQ